MRLKIKMRDYVQLFFGKSFTGKTARMMYELRDETRVVLVDPKCGSLTKLEGWDHEWPAFDEERHIWLGKSFLDYFRQRLRGRFRVAVHLRNFHPEQLNMLCALLMRVKNCTVAIDELGIFVPSGPPNALPKFIQTAVISGRHEGLRFIGTAQRPYFVHATLRANASVMSWYRMTERNDLNVARGYFPDSLASSLPSLPDYVCIEWSDSREAFRNESLVGKFGAPESPMPGKPLKTAKSFSKPLF